MCTLCGYTALTYANAASTPNAGGSGPNFYASQGATSDQNLNGVLSGSKWGGTTLTYSFPTSAGNYESGYAHALNGFEVAPAATQAAVRSVMAELARYTNLNVSESTSVPYTADLRVAFSSTPATAEAFYPFNDDSGGDVWFGKAYPEFRNPIKGDYGWATTIHEIGHALGLKHAHETGGVANTAMQTQFDHMAYSIMSYRGYQGANSTGGYQNEQFGYATTFMMYDILALQTMNGANFNTQSGNTTYRWNKDTGEMSIDGAGQGAPGGNRIFMTLWDGNGTDTYNFDNYTTNLQIDLRPGNFSRLSDVQIANLGDGNFAGGNIYNALQFQGDARSLIENAVGGTGGDTMLGNTAGNTLWGNQGNDRLEGFEGDDFLFGEWGADLVLGGAGGDQIGGNDENDSLFGEDGNDTIWGDGGADQIGGNAGDDQLFGFADNDTIWADGGNDQARGGAGDDQIFGFDGNDVVDGEDGADAVRGGTGADTVYGGAGNDFMDGEDGDDRMWGFFDNDTMLAGAGNDIVDGEDGDDRLYGWLDNDTLLGGGGADFLDGEDGNDLIFGWIGNDTVLGGNGTDDLVGEDGDDFLAGWNDNDTLQGGAGNDVLRGEGGNDTFVYFANAGNDTIEGFEGGAGAGDVIRILGQAAFDTFEKVQTAATVDAGAVVINLTGTSIRIANVSSFGALNADDFLFT